MSRKTLRYFTWSIAGLTLVSCLISIFRNDLYQDGAWANAQWLGQDLVTLVLALPLLLVSYSRGIKGDCLRWQMVYAGILFYYFYTYSFFMFAANLTMLYAFHLPIYALASIGLVVTLIGIFNQERGLYLDKKGLRAGILVYLMLISVMITFLWISDIVAHWTDPAHRSVTPDGKAPLIIYSLDLGIVIPLMVASAILLVKKRRWGYLLTGVILTKTSTLGFALMAMGASMYVQNLNPEYYLVILWSVIGLVGTFLTYRYLQALRMG